MEYVMFADESGTNDGSPCFTIGSLIIPSDELEQFEAQINNLIIQHGLPAQELKWESLRNSYGRINFIIDVLKLLLADNSYVFMCKVTLKAAYRKWLKDEESAFYTCHTHLLTYSADSLGATIVANIDDKSDSYKKHDEVVQIIANYNLADKDARVSSVNKQNSKEVLLIQIADLLTGAVNASHNLYQLPDFQLHHGKHLAIEKLAACLGWKHLHHDTYPNSNFNIWHFPEKEFRRTPSTKQISPNFEVGYVSKADF